MFTKKQCTIQEQIIEDPASGLTIQFEVGPNGHTYMRLYGECLSLGNREIEFNLEGVEAGAGTAIGGPARPLWLVDLGGH